MHELVEALEATGYAFAHVGWSHAPDGDYGVFTEERSNDLRANNVHCESVLRLAVDYFTRDGSGTPKKTIETALNGICCAWYLNSVQFEYQTGYLHYEWVVEVGED